MKIRFGFLALVTVLCADCWPQTNALPEACRLSEHCFGIIHELSEPIVVRSVEGEIRISSSLPNDPLKGATVEIFGPDSSEKHLTQTDEHGKFKIKGLAEGNYRFHVGASGFNSVVGRLTVSRRAPRSDKVHVALTFGV